MFTTLGIWKPTRLSLETGTVLWSTDTEDETGYLGRWRSRLLAGGDKLCALDMNTGTIQWSRPRVVGIGKSFVLGDTIVCQTADASTAVDLQTNEVQWNLPGYVSNPLVSDGTVVVAADEVVQCIDFLTGEVRWKHDASRYGGNPDDTGCLRNGLFLAEFSERLAAVDVNSGDVAWTSGGPPILLWYPYVGHAYLIYSDDTYSVRRLEDGSVTHEGRIQGGSTAVWMDCRLAVGETHLFVAEGTGHITCIDIETGRVDQVVELPGEPDREPILYRNHLLITDFDSNLHCFKGTD